jgi:hypothetical protein
MIGDVISRTLNTSPMFRRLKRVVLLLFVAIILMATNPSLDEFKAYAMLNSENPSEVTAARTSYWLLFSIYKSRRFDKDNSTWRGEDTYVGVLNNFINVGSRGL